MTQSLTEKFCHEVIGTFSFGERRVLAWDSFRCHITPGVNRIQNHANVDHVIIPGGCKKFIHAPNVSWNKPLKEYLWEMYDDWLTAEGGHQLTPQGNMRPPTR